MSTALGRIWQSQAAGADLSGDRLLFIALAGCSLDEKPGSNWVQDNGGLPEYICQIAKGIKKSGHPTSEAIAMAVATVRNWASGQKGVTPKTRAKAAAAVAEWEALRAKAHAKHAAKSAGNHVGMTASDGWDLVGLSDPVTFNIDAVRDAYEAQRGKTMYLALKPGKGEDSYIRSSWVEQMWSTFLVATGDLDGDGDTDHYKIPFEVDAKTGEVSFGAPVEVHQEWVLGDGSALNGDEDELGSSALSDDDLSALLALARLSAGPTDPLTSFLKLAGI